MSKSKLNIARMKKLITVLARKRRGFTMDTWVKINKPKETLEQARTAKCGTVGCIAGWAYLLFGPDTDYLLQDDSYSSRRKGKKIDIADEAQKLLGMDNYQASIFYDTYQTKKTLLDKLRNMVKEAENDTKNSRTN